MTNDYPEILTPDNIWIAGLTQEQSTQDYYLVLYYDIEAILSRFIRIYNTLHLEEIMFIPYDDFDEIEKIGSNGYATVYTANCDYLEQVALKQYKNFDGKTKMFISEVSIT